MMKTIASLLPFMVPVLLTLMWIDRLRRRWLRADAGMDAAASIAHPPGEAPNLQLARRLIAPGSSAPSPLTSPQAARLRPLLLHWLGLRTDLAAAQIAAQVPMAFRQRWYTLDLQHLSADSDPRAALAFACLRVAFYLRGAYLLGWLDKPLYTRILHLNACRARECFPVWYAFARACIQGRAQWQASGHIDVFGDYHTPEQLRVWLWDENSSNHQAGQRLTL